jgi:hypothetical protein
MRSIWRAAKSKPLYALRAADYRLNFPMSTSFKSLLQALDLLNSLASFDPITEEDIETSHPSSGDAFCPLRNFQDGIPQWLLKVFTNQVKYLH